MAQRKTADELRKLADELARIADSLEEKPKEDKPEKEVSFTDLRALLANKSREGHTEKIKELLIAHGAEKLSEIDPKEYASLAKEAEVL